MERITIARGQLIQQVEAVDPRSPESGYFTVPGFLRYQVFEENGRDLATGNYDGPGQVTGPESDLTLILGDANRPEAFLTFCSVSSHPTEDSEEEFLEFRKGVMAGLRAKVQRKKQPAKSYFYMEGYLAGWKEKHSVGSLSPNASGSYTVKEKEWLDAIMFSFGYSFSGTVTREMIVRGLVQEARRRAESSSEYEGRVLERLEDARSKAERSPYYLGHVADEEKQLAKVRAEAKRFERLADKIERIGVNDEMFRSFQAGARHFDETR
jgi:hypothetical protein